MADTLLIHVPKADKGPCAGIDEVGRGCLAGPVVAAAVMLPEHFSLPGLTDSKKLTAKKREALACQIKTGCLAWAIGLVGQKTIDRINILQASILGMHRALAQLKIVPEHILVDGNKWKPYIPDGDLLEIPARTVVKGDATYMSIAAASVLAKTYRDDYMLRLHGEYPMYHWDDNKGYPTPAHYEAIRQYGITPYHRKTFNLRMNTCK